MEKMEQQDIELPEKLTNLIIKIAGDQGLNNSVEVVSDGKTSFFEGYTSNVFFITVTEASSNKVLRLVAKLGIDDISSRFGYAIRENFSNECLFYKELWPTFRNLQLQSVKKLLVDVIPTCYFSDLNKETIVMENLKAQNYVTFPRNRLYDTAHLELFFTVFGQYHALSFAYKKLSPTGFEDFAKRFTEVRNFANHKVFKQQLTLAYEQCLRYCEKEFSDKKISEKLKAYDYKIFFDALRYNGDHAVFAHGDCWSNNMLFKYEGEVPVALKLIDFQDTKARSVVHDLSYNFYSGADATEFSRLLHYLTIYHASLCRMLNNFGMDGTVLYPFEVLLEEWKIYSKFGFTMALLLTKLKLAYEGQELSLPDIMASDKKPEELEADKYDSEGVNKRYKEIVIHFYENDYL